MSLVEAARYANSLDAGVAHGRLEAEGLHCVLFDEGFSSVEGVGAFIPVRLMVLDDEFDQASQILESMAEGVRGEPAKTTVTGWASLFLILLAWPILPFLLLFKRRR